VLQSIDRAISPLSAGVSPRADAINVQPLSKRKVDRVGPGIDRMGMQALARAEPRLSLHQDLPVGTHLFGSSLGKCPKER